MNRAGRHYLWVFLVSSSLYFLSGLINSLPFQKQRIVDIATRFDGQIFYTHAVWVYALYYLLMVYPILGRQSYEDSVRLGRSILSFSVFAFFVFLAMPVEIYRPPETMIAAGPSGLLLRFIYTLDQPYNCFPSLHVLHSWIIALHFYRLNTERLWVRYVLLLSAAGVTFSTVIVRQHYVLDVVASLVLTAIWLIATNSLRLKRVLPQPLTQSFD